MNVFSSMVMVMTSDKSYPRIILTDRERQIATACECGQLHKDIAQNLQLSVKTIEYHVAHILNKTGAKRLKQACFILRRSGSL